MTIEEAIEHCKEIVTENRRRALEFARANVYDAARHCQACATEYEQLAEWLTELKRRREADIAEQPKTNADRIRQMTDEELAESLSGSVPCGHVMSCLDTSCYECTLKWLKQDVDEGGGE